MQININTKWFDCLAGFDKAIVGSIYRVTVMYLSTGIEDELSGTELLLWQRVKQEVDRDRALSQKRSRAGKLGIVAASLDGANDGASDGANDGANDGAKLVTSDNSLNNNGNENGKPARKSICPDMCDIDKSLLSLSPTPSITNNQGLDIYNINNNILNNNSSKEKASKKKASSFSLEFVQPELLSVFQRFIAMRKSIGKAIKTQHTVQCRYNTLMRLSGGDTDLAIQIAEQSIDHEWEDFYALKSERQQKQENKVYRNEDYW